MNIDDRLDRDVEGWRPNTGDKLIGTVVGITEGESEYGPYPIIEVQVADGRIVGAHCFHTVLRNEIKGRRPAIGDDIGIKYKGKSAGKGGRQPYDDYSVALDPGPNHNTAAAQPAAAAAAAPAPTQMARPSAWEEPF
jgi:hypothetical protein